MAKQAPSVDAGASRSTARTLTAEELMAVVRARPAIKPLKPEDMSPALRIVYEEGRAIRHLICAIDGLRRGKVLAPDTAKFVADALAAALLNPSKAAQALGIAKSRGRPELTHDPRKIKMARDVMALQLAGTPLSSSRREGAFEIVARRFHTSPVSVQRAWKEHRDFVQLERVFLAWDAQQIN